MRPPACANCIHVMKGSIDYPQLWRCKNTRREKESYDIITGKTETLVSLNYCDWERRSTHSWMQPPCGPNGYYFASHEGTPAPTPNQVIEISAPKSKFPMGKFIWFALLLLALFSAVLTFVEKVKAAPPEMQEKYDRSLHRMTPGAPFTVVIRIDGKRVDRVFRGCFVDVDETAYNVSVLNCEYGP